MNLLQKLIPVRSFIFEFHGVLTDGHFTYSRNGEQSVNVFEHDISAISIALNSGYHVSIILSEKDNWIRKIFPDHLTKFIQAGEENIDNAENLRSLDAGMDQYDSVLMLTDQPNLILLKPSWILCAPFDATVEIKNNAQFISLLKGGMGCVRDIIEKIMKLNGHWPY